jgi:hypothetical protein
LGTSIPRQHVLMPIFLPARQGNVLKEDAVGEFKKGWGSPFFSYFRRFFSWCFKHYADFANSLNEL